MELLEQLVAEREIRQLIARYAQLADDRDAAAFAALFITQGELATPTKRCVGHLQIQDWLLSTFDAGRSRHLFANPIIEIDSAKEASGSMDMLALRGSVDSWVVAATLRYTDRYVRTEQGWKFAERVLKLMMP